MTEKAILTIKETVERSKRSGLPISEYSLRRAIHNGSIPCRRVGAKYLVAWINVERWLLCLDGADNIPAGGTATPGEIRRVEAAS